MSKKKIAVFTTGWPGEILYQYLNGLTDGLKSISADVYTFLNFAVVSSSERDFHGQINIFELPHMEDFDAALVFANGLDFPAVLDRLNQKFKAANIPVIYTGKDVEDFYFVGSENSAGTKELARHLITVHGARDIWFIAGSADNADSNSRLKAVREVMEENGLSLNDTDICYTNWSPYVGYTYVIDRLKKGDKKPDAIICANDTLAMVICAELRNMSLKVPDDICITGFDNEFLAQVYDPSISSVDQRFDNIGRKCAEVLCDVFEGKEVERAHRVSCEFVPSESCGCTSAKDFNAIRRRIGRDKFEDKIHASNFDIKLTTVEHFVLQGRHYEDLSGNLQHLYSRSNEYEGHTVCVVIDPLFKETIQDYDLSLREDGYPEEMHLAYSKDKDSVFYDRTIKSRQIFPLINPQGENRFFIVLPLNDSQYSMGYIVFGDDLQKIKESANLRKYTERLDLILSKFHQNLRLDTLNQHLRQMNETDALTHVKNRSAFETRQGALQSAMCSDKKPGFAIAVFDVNNLKYINDNLGHEAGDAYIINACRLICKTFKKSAVYRIGGDEFVVVMENDDYNNREELLGHMQAEMKRLSETDCPATEKISIASGLAVYDMEQDFNISDVFKRADSAMYENKALMKGKNPR